MLSSTDSTTSHTPKITVLIPVYNGEKYLKECLESVLTQTFTDFECLVIDDGSTDDSQAVVQSFTDPRIRFLRNEKNLGVALTRNKGLDLARGEYVVFIDCDDISVPDRLRKQVDFMDANSRIGICGSWVQEIYADGEPIPGQLHQYPVTDPEIREMMMWTCPVWNPSIIIRQETVKKFVVRHEPCFISASDFDFLVKMASVSRLANLPEVLHYYRRHKNQITSRRTFEANRNANLIRMGLIVSEVQKFLPGITYRPAEATQLLRLSAAGFFEKLLMADQLLEKLPVSGEADRQAAYNRLRQYLDIIWFSSLSNLPRYEMPVFRLLKRSSFFRRLPLWSRLTLQTKSLLGLRPAWIRRMRTLLRGRKRLAWQ